jgi:hypothetical protein
MDLQTMAQEAATRSGMRYDPSDIDVADLGVGLEFITAVRDSWRDLQMESNNWWFRQALDQTLALAASDDDYAMPSGLESINYRTVSVYETAKTDETPVQFIHYEDWRWRDTVSTSEARPRYITERPDAVLQVWPVPDQIYTLRFDGVWDIDDMTANADTPGDTITAGTQLLPDRYHWILVWDAVRRITMKYEDAARYAAADERFRSLRARLSEKQMPPVYVKSGVLTGHRTFRGWGG